MNKSIYGYFDSPEQTEPSYDPGMQVPCPVCNKELGGRSTGNPVMTISLMIDSDEISPRDTRSYFYRVHRGCYESLDEEQQAILDWEIVDSRAKATRENN